jgi:hypothetical protein
MFISNPSTELHRVSFARRTSPPFKFCPGDPDDCPPFGTMIKRNDMPARVMTRPDQVEGSLAFIDGALCAGLSDLIDDCCGARA